MRWLPDHNDSFDWLVQVKSRLLATGGLSMREVPGVLNCWRAAMLRGSRTRAPIGRGGRHVVFYQVDPGRGRWAGYV